METVIGTIGVVTVGTIVSSITTISSSIYSLVSNIKVSRYLHNDDIIKIITSTDVEATIELLQAVMLEIPEEHMNSPSILISLKNVHNVIEEIENELKDLHSKLEYNKSLYILSNWRSHNFKDNLDKIELLVSILDRRKDNLFKILNTFSIEIKNSCPIEITNTDKNKQILTKLLSKFNDLNFEVINKNNVEITK